MNWLLLILCAVNTWWLAALLFPTRGLDKAVCLPVMAMGHVVLVGYLCSWLNRLDQMGCWIVLEGVLLVVLLVVAFFSTRARARMWQWPSPPWFFRRMVELCRGLTRRECGLLAPLWATVFGLGIINGLIVLRCAPHNWDSMTYHLARVAYFLQQGSLAHYDANYWAQVAHPRNSAVMLIFSWLASGCRENWMQAPQFVAYWTCVVALFGIAREVFKKDAAGLFAAGCFGLFISALMQATTTQNDLLLAALACCAVYALFRFKTIPSRRYLWLAAMAIGLGLGTKVSFLLVGPALGLIFVYVVLAREGVAVAERVRVLVVFAGMLLGALLLWTAPSGYIANIRLYGHPVGPEDVRAAHSFEGGTLSHRLKFGTKNVLRFGVDAASLESLPPATPVLKCRNASRRLIGAVMASTGLDLEDTQECRAPFAYLRPLRPHEDSSYWGITGFAFIWMVALLSVLFILPGWDMRWLSIGFFMFWALQGYIGPYDPWRGRYFTAAAAFGAPLAGYLMTTRKRWVYLYLQVVVWVAIITALSAVTFRDQRALITVDWPAYKSRSVFSQDRHAQLMSNRPWELDALRAYETLVPPDATVGLVAPVDRYEYPFFGPGMTRRVIPLIPYLIRQQPFPDHMDYIVYEEGYCPRCENDVHLGVTWWLHPVRKECD